MIESEVIPAIPPAVRRGIDRIFVAMARNAGSITDFSTFPRTASWSWGLESRYSTGPVGANAITTYRRPRSAATIGQATFANARQMPPSHP